MLDSAVNFRTQADIKEQAFNVIKSYGLTPAQVLNMFLTQIAKTNTIPLSLDYPPNTKTANAINELMSGKGERFSVDSFDEFQQKIRDLSK
ncbi:type II toxin-antitoxin system RelB/DinJ family antitoxin [Aggregatibacter actinomycetemcomitans]|uniref:type II toxin-antitoxin system RelB/DinJ family antitoxin n=1 Tax=Aggregatibacter actinomycetemcomitans TaxID=714 RepID=UPI002150AD84|nr:type II toxin-antitoxin system RelB/DinJ family antitoxin [Aggregatibacter actinomycetemcomitans]